MSIEKTNRRKFIRNISAAVGAVTLPTGTSCLVTARGHIQSKDPDVSYNTLPLWRGFNLQEKFTHSPDAWLDRGAPEWGFSNQAFRESDFELIRELGFNFVRLPMSYKCWCEEDDWYRLKEKPLREIDQAVEYGKQYGIHVAINFHHAPGYRTAAMKFAPKYREKTSIWDDEETLKACAFHWRHFAERYKGIPNKRLSFNLFNEPVGTTVEKHDSVIRYLAAEIRSVDPNRLIVIDGLHFMPNTTLLDLKVSQCTRGYQPVTLTHYKASWLGDFDVYPTWPIEDHKGHLWNRNKLLEGFQPWKELEEKGTGVYVGEFGVYNRTPHDVTLAFLKDNLSIWKDYGWGWAMWCFRGSFGVADSGREDVKYEKYKGVLLDREMLNLLQQY